MQKKNGMWQSEIDPFLGSTKTLITDQYVICCSLLHQFSSVSLSQILTGSILTHFFHTQSFMDQDNELYLTDIVLSGQYIIEPYMGSLAV